jgi:hypothetical protein
LFSFFGGKLLRSRFFVYHWLYGINIDIVSVFNIISQVCVASVEKKVTIYFFHIYYTLESHSVYNYFCFAFDVCVCFLFCFCFDIYSRPWLRTKFDWCLIDMYSTPTPSNYKGMILIETLIYENQNLTHWYSPIQLFLIRKY